MSQIEKGVIYYKRPADYEGDFTKGCGLAGDEIDSNMHFLRGNDIQTIEWDKINEHLIFTYVGGKRFVIDGINAIKPDALTTNEILKNIDNIFKIVGNGYTSDIGKNEYGEFEIDESETIYFKINKQREDFESHVLDNSEKFESIFNKNIELDEKDNELNKKIDDEISERLLLGEKVEKEINDRLVESYVIKNDIIKNKIVSFSNQDKTLETKINTSNDGTYISTNLKISESTDFLKKDGGGLTDNGVKVYIDTNINKTKTQLNEKINANNSKIDGINNAIDAIIVNIEDSQNLIENNKNDLLNLIAEKVSERKDEDKEIKDEINVIKNDISGLHTTIEENDNTFQKIVGTGFEGKTITTTLNDEIKRSVDNDTELKRLIGNGFGANTITEEILVEIARAEKEEKEIRKLIGNGYGNEQSITEKLNDEILRAKNEEKRIDSIIGKGYGEETITNKLNIVEDKLDTFLTGESSDNVIITLIELQKYIESHGEIASEALLNIKKAQETADEAKGKSEQAQNEVDALEIVVNNNKLNIENALQSKISKLSNEINGIKSDYLKSNDKQELLNEVNTEHSLRESEDKLIRSEFENADNLLREDFESADNLLRKDFESADETITSSLNVLNSDFSEYVRVTNETLSTISSTINNNKTDFEQSLSDLNEKVDENTNSINDRVSSLESINHDEYKDADELLKGDIIKYIDKKNENLTNIINDVKELSEDNRKDITNNTQIISEYIKTVNEAFKNVNANAEEMQKTINGLNQRISVLEEFIKTVITQSNIINYAVTNIDSETNDIVLDNNIGNVNMRLNKISNTTF